MQFHLNGFEPGDPDIADPAERILPSGMAGSVPEEVDVLIVGCGPAGLTLAAQLVGVSRHQDLHRRAEAGPLLLGQADGIACRTMEMFEAFGFSERVLKEACWINETTFWKPDEKQPRATSCAAAGSRTSRTGCRNSRMSMLNQARVHDFYLDVMRKSPTQARAVLLAAPARSRDRTRRAVRTTAP